MLGLTLDVAVVDGQGPEPPLVVRKVRVESVGDGRRVMITLNRAPDGGRGSRLDNPAPRDRHRWAAGGGGTGALSRHGRGRVRGTGAGPRRGPVNRAPAPDRERVLLKFRRRDVPEAQGQLLSRSWAGPTQVNLAPGPVVYSWKAR